MDGNYDFSGWATKANLVCSDGLTIQKNAFAECDGMKVPLVWNHKHDDPNAVLGHAVLENREDGVYAYGTFNDTESGQNAKLLLHNGDVDQLSIYANKLKRRGSNVIHGVIREVSLVLAGANPGARIESVIMHNDDSYEEGMIYTGEYLEYVAPLIHAETEKKGDPEMVEETKKTSASADSEKTVGDILDSLSEKQKKAIFAIVGQIFEEAKNGEDKEDKEEKEDKEPEIKEKDEVKHADEEADDGEETIGDILESLSEKQKKAVCAIVCQILEEAGIKVDDEDEKDEKDEKDEGGNTNMKHNVFDQETEMKNDVLTHSEMAEILDDAKRNGSLADTVLQHGITNVDYMFPEAQMIDKTPGFIKREDTWVTEVMNGVHKSPFSRIKSVFANITESEARAKGYVKGNKKVDEVFTMLKRVTTPTTIYKKQNIDRDDVVDITDFDVVAWLKAEMRMMLDEEIARAILVGDGRQSSNNDKINEQNIRPIWTDDEIYTVTAEVAVSSDTTDDQKAKGFIKACIKSRKNYKGSGNPVMYISEDMLTNCLLLEDTNGRVIYDTVEKLATALRVKKIVPVPVMENLTREKGANTHTLAGIYVNLVDYNIGADKGGAVNMFDDFDIDYNQMKYLIETRCSGALIKPFSAVAIELVAATE